ncbi:MAG: mechanosensitive ion channel family protein [Gemmatimonadaceae bacterium]
MTISPLVKQLARRTGLLFVIFLAAKIVPAVVDFPARYEQRIDRVLEYVAVFAIFIQAAVWVSAAVSYWAGRYVERHDTQRADMTTIQAVSVLVKLLLWAILLLMAFDQLGKNVTGLIAGLGVGGIAVAFALQNVLGDLFAAMSIVTDKPFVIGDTIQVDTMIGSVERIGLKSTRVRSEGGEQIVFGNSDLLKGRIRNYGRMEERRATITTRVAGSTQPEQLEQIPTMMKEVVTGHPTTRFVRSTMTAVGDSTIDFVTVYYLTNPSYQIYADTQQAVLLESLRRLQQAGITLSAQLEAAVKEKYAGQMPLPTA